MSRSWRAAPISSPASGVQRRMTVPTDKRKQSLYFPVCSAHDDLRVT